jgi:uncharacterized membrane protein YkvA (DUF1232 family)
MKRDWSVLKTVLIGAGALLYGASPIDIIPDVIAPFGFGDDAVVLVAAGVAIWRILRGRAARRATGPTPRPDDIRVDPPTQP